MNKDRGLFVLALPGFLLALGIAVFSYWLSGLHRFLDVFAAAIIIGLLVGSCFPRKNSLWIGTAVCKDMLLPLGLFMYGTEINFKKLTSCCVIGSNILFLCVIYALGAFLIVYIINRILKVTHKTNLLTSSGSAICGIAAIAVGSSMIDPDEEDVTKSVIAILFVGLVAFLCTMFFLKSSFFTADIYGEKFAVFCGMTLNQEGLVEVAGNFMDRGLDKLALNVKYIRSVFIVPVAFIILFMSQLRKNKARPEIVISVIKYGLVIGCLFFIAALLFTYTPLGAYSEQIRPLYKIIFGAALAAVGLTCDIRKVFKKDTLLNMISALIGWIIVVVAFIAMMILFPASINVNLF